MQKTCSCRFVALYVPLNFCHILYTAVKSIVSFFTGNKSSEIGITAVYQFKHQIPVFCNIKIKLMLIVLCKEIGFAVFFL